MVAMPNGSEYVAAKHGVIGLTRGAALDYAGQGIRVNAVLPGVIETAIFERQLLNPSAQPLLRALRELHPMKRFGRPSEIAETAAWLLSDYSSFVTGTTVAADGGFLAA